ncbi:pyrimidine 5'-nucleotidase [Xinfangfangia sp. CPCC 101601]|uniref:Pyrimidine 5'-nucleotidase n=1 Tax=Pseudogemmobacter lacusdianii TaxID=3069608 RepID=A0ABU0VVS9_9RHOB|nr:pyrimidine 5'-nucleotidase [Xinfangfangia sp. CPCC 101601]MDQ2065861.1 pyrimidine 5'-nucleotidase [Xinfangfangia sp. CPCC 101601]
MLQPDFHHVTTWVFDLDNTLYPPSARLFDQIERKMTDWVMTKLGVDRDRADHLRSHYWGQYGTTLAGLMAEHAITPGDYLTAVHDIDFAALQPDLLLTEHLKALPGRRIVHTNADAAYAAKVLQARGLDGLFDAIYGVEETLFHPKPGAQAYEAVLALDGFDPSTAAMFEDDPRNLAVPHALGMRTVLVAPEPLTQPHIHHHTIDLTEFLGKLTGR